MIQTYTLLYIYTHLDKSNADCLLIFKDLEEKKIKNINMEIFSVYQMSRKNVHKYSNHNNISHAFGPYKI